MFESNIPDAGKKMDFIITGHDKDGKSGFSIAEMKQWEGASAMGGIDRRGHMGKTL